MLLELRDVTLHYEGVSALKGIFLHVDKQEMVALVGSNGAGKSSTLRAISGLTSPTSGEIWFDGRIINGLAPHEIVKRGIVHVPEGRRVFPYMSCFENLKMGAYLRKGNEEIEKDYQIVYSHFPVLRLRRRQNAGTLSGGEQQMLAIGRALMANPRLLLLDEPSLGLSPIMCREISKILSEISVKLRISVILVEQNVRMALRLADRGYVLEMGKIALHGAAEELVHNEEVKRAYLGL